MLGRIPGTLIVIGLSVLGFALAAYAIWWMIFRMGKD
jgi:hypothetical protein